MRENSMTTQPKSMLFNTEVFRAFRKEGNKLALNREQLLIYLVQIRVSCRCRLGSREL